MKTKGYIFDYGGTLDTAGCHWGKMLWHAYERQSIPVTEEQFREAYVFAERTLGKNPIIQTDYTFRKTLEVKLRIEFEYLQAKGYLCGNNFCLASMQATVLDDLYERVRTITAKSKDVLVKLRELYSIALVSNFYGNLPVVLEEFGLSGLFNTVVESAVVGIRKPDTRIFQLGVDALGLPPEEITVVGDSISKDIAPAKRLGCQTVWIKGEGWTDQPEDTSMADRIISDLTEIIQ
ncbi:MAG: HAD family hydrolase [Prevotella sp.]